MKKAYFSELIIAALVCARGPKGRCDTRARGSGYGPVSQKQSSNYVAACISKLEIAQNNAPRRRNDEREGEKIEK
jgi:hypothetical protein